MYSSERTCRIGNDVRAFVHRQEQIAKMKSLGATEVFVGDMQSKDDMIEVLNGISFKGCNN